jgi:hypothetical protein
MEDLTRAQNTKHRGRYWYCSLVLEHMGSVDGCRSRMHDPRNTRFIGSLPVSEILILPKGYRLDLSRCGCGYIVFIVSSSRDTRREGSGNGHLRPCACRGRYRHDSSEKQLNWTGQKICQRDCGAWRTMITGVMLRVPVHEEPALCRLELSGRLEGPWVAETERVWRSSLCLTKEMEVDLRQLMGADGCGKKLLSPCIAEEDASSLKACG